MRTARRPIRTGRTVGLTQRRWRTRQTDVCRSWRGFARARGAPTRQTDVCRSRNAPQTDVCRSWGARGAFTLVEMLVAVVILVTLMALAAAAFRRSPADQINASARRVQAQTLLARHMALRDRRVTGIRLIQSANDPWVADAIQLIASPGFDTGTADIVWNQNTRRWVVANNTPGEWMRLAPDVLNPSGRNLIRPGQRIELPAGSGKWYTVRIPEDLNLNGTLDPGEDLDNDSNLDINLDWLVLDGHYTPSEWDGSAYVATPNVNVPYRLELAPTVTAASEPIRLQPGTVIDLAASENLPPTLDILFAPGQGLAGESAVGGNIYLYITTLQDVELTRNLNSSHPANGGGPFIPQPFPFVPANPPNVPKDEPAAIAIFAQTGNVMSVPVDLTDGAVAPPLIADDPYRYARRGKELSR